MKGTPLVILLALCLGLFLSACAPTTPELPTGADADTGGSAPTATPVASPTPEVFMRGTPTMPDRVPVRWFVGLGTGTSASQVEAQQAIVNDFNASQDKIELVLDIVDNNIAYDVLAQDIANGNAPDIVGPMGIQGRASYSGAWADLTPFIEKYQYSLADFDPELIKFYQVEGEGQLGIPFAVYPSFIYVNRDLFDAAGLNYPPQEYGAPYINEKGEAQEWNTDTLRELAMKLTYDADGHDGFDPNFDPATVAQFGFGTMLTDMRGRLTMFGAGNLVDDTGQATFPDNWRAGLQWYYDAMWKEHFHPTALDEEAGLFGGTNDWFKSGKLAMGQTHLWYASSRLEDFPGHWTVAVMPTYNGVATAKLHADTFGMIKTTRHPDETFQVMMWMLGEKADELAQIYGGMPARQSLQGAYFDTFAQQFPNQRMNWTVVTSGLSHPDIPNHEEGLPNFLAARDRYRLLDEAITHTPDLDLNAEVQRLLTDLQTIYDNR